MKLNLTPAGRPADINSMTCTPIGKALWDQHDGRPAFLEGITIERTEILDTEGLIRDLLPPRYMNKIVYRIPATGPVVMGACLYDGTGYIYTVKPEIQPTLRMRVMCADGFSVSVQASRYHYCHPRQDSGPYSQVELGYPSNRPTDEVMTYREDPTGSPTETVYPYVPADAVMRLLAEHGGVVAGQLPPLALDSPTIPEPVPVGAVAAPSPEDGPVHDARTVELVLHALRQAQPTMTGHIDDNARMFTFEDIVDELRKVGVLSQEQANSLFRTTWRKQAQP